jgi:hypothetical protein
MFSGKGYDATMADIWALGVILFIMLAGFPPFARPNNGDWWFNKLSTGRHNLFWQAHSRSAYFSEATKDFINKILNPDPAKRISLADMKKHEWFEGTTISEKALETELNRRKTDVDERKQRAKNEKKKKQAEKPAETSTAAASQVEAVRGLPFEELPEDNPSWEQEQQLEEQPKERKEEASAIIAPSNPFSSTSPFTQLNESKEKEAVPPAYDPLTSITCYTRFESVAKGSDILARLGGVLDQMRGVDYSVNKKKFTLRAKVILGSGNIVFVAKVYSDPADSSKAIVEFRRRKGDSMQYRSIYSAVLDQLSDLVSKPEKEEKESKPFTEEKKADKSEKQEEKQAESQEKKETVPAVSS